MMASIDIMWLAGGIGADGVDSTSVARFLSSRFNLSYISDINLNVPNDSINTYTHLSQVLDLRIQLSRILLIYFVFVY